MKSSPCRWRNSGVPGFSHTFSGSRLTIGSRHDRVPGTLEEYIPHTQEYVARLFQLAIERSRRLKYNPAGGILHFHAIDVWPSVTMAAVDLYRVPTKVYETVKRSFSPVLVSFEYDRDQWRPGERFRCGR